jgi:hypothetical protein
MLLTRVNRGVQPFAAERLRPCDVLGQAAGFGEAKQNRLRELIAVQVAPLPSFGQGRDQRLRPDYPADTQPRECNLREAPNQDRSPELLYGWERVSRVPQYPINVVLYQSHPEFGREPDDSLPRIERQRGAGGVLESRRQHCNRRPVLREHSGEPLDVNAALSDRHWSESHIGSGEHIPLPVIDGILNGNYRPRRRQDALDQVERLLTPARNKDVVIRASAAFGRCLFEKVVAERRVPRRSAELQNGRGCRTRDHVAASGLECG